MTATPETLELPRLGRLLLTTGWNLAESFGFPLGGYVLFTWLWGRDAGLFAMLTAIWVTAGIRWLVTRSLPSLVIISLVVLTIQAVLAIATGNLLIFLIHFPLANLALCIVFARTARGHSPLAARLAAEVIGLNSPAIRQPPLDRFFQQVTVLWAGIFLLLAVGLGVLLVTIPTGIYVAIWAVTTIVLIGAGVGASVLWFRSVLREHGIGWCFAPTDPVQCAPPPGANPSPNRADDSGG